MSTTSPDESTGAKSAADRVEEDLEDAMDSLSAAIKKLDDAAGLAAAEVDSRGWIKRSLHLDEPEPPPNGSLHAETEGLASLAEEARDVLIRIAGARSDVATLKQGE